MDNAKYDEPDFGFGLSSEELAEMARLKRWEKIEEILLEVLDAVVYVYAGAVTAYLHLIA